jgi:hypothetical protein
VSTDDRLTLASVSNCGCADVVIRHDRWSSGTVVSTAPLDTTACGRNRSAGWTSLSASECGPRVDHDLGAAELVAVERFAEHDVRGCG